MPPVTYSSKVANRHFTVLEDFGLLACFLFVVWADLLRIVHSCMFVCICANKALSLNKLRVHGKFSLVVVVVVLSNIE